MKQDELKEEEIPDQIRFRDNFKEKTNDREIVKLLLKKKEISYSNLADLTGYTRKNNIYNFLRDQNKTGMTTDVLVKILHAMHCDIAIFDLDDGTEYDLELLSEQEGDQK